MAQDTVTNFLSSTKDILVDIQSKLSADSTFNIVTIMAGNKFDELWRTLPPHASPPFACVMYMGSTFQQIPRRAYKFRVIVVARHLTDADEAQRTAMDLIDHVIGVIDHESFENLLYRVAGDEWMEYKHAGVSCYGIDFVAEDY